MLVLSRKKGESIMIGDQIELVILGTEGDTIRIGVNAPRSINVYRKEVYDSIKASNVEASMARISPSQLPKMMKKEDNSRK
ncbi:MAG: carbon storage regulator [Paenibacillaceae bacterium]|jgi:carbon storage regulator|nr:carbon storage regulator [Paenibacillaceae bacterium]